MGEYGPDDWKYWDTIIIVITIAHFLLVTKKMRGARVKPEAIT
ncbi:17641_t:CDS:1, partial [Acaulospora morrowiae]